MKVLLLLAPSAQGISGGTERAVRRIKSAEPLSLVSIATLLRKEGIDTKVIDLDVEDVAVERVLAEFSPKVVGIASSISTFVPAKALCRLSKKAGAFVVLGGHSERGQAKEALLGSDADALVIGEGELTFLDLCRRIEKGKPDWKKTKGICYRKGGKPLFTRPRELVKDLDRLPFPDRRLIDRRNYSFPGYPRGAWTKAMISRGCPYPCAFCGSSLALGKQVRIRSVESVISEIRDILSLGYRGIDFSDDIFGFDPKWLSEFSREMVRTGLSKRIAWMCQRRADLVDRKTVRALKRAGCVRISIGMESGSQRVLDSMKKGISPGDIRRAVSVARSEGMRIHAHVMLGYPGETWDDIELTKRLLLDADPDSFGIGFFFPIDGTEASKRILSEGVAPEAKFTKRSFNFFEAELEGELSREDLRRAKREIYRAFWLRPGKIARGALNAVFLGNFTDKLDSLRAMFSGETGYLRKAFGAR